MWHVHKMEYCLKKEGNLNICYNMDRPGGQCTKWNKLVTVVQICMIYP